MAPAPIVAGTIGFTTALYLSGVQFSSSYLSIPPLYNLGTSTAAKFFNGFWWRGFSVGAPLSTISTISFAAAAYLEPTEQRRALLIAAAVGTASTVGWTQLAMMPTNKKLLALGEPNATTVADSEETVQLLKSWYWLNLARAGLALIGGVVGVVAVVG